LRPPHRSPPAQLFFLLWRGFIYSKHPFFWCGGGLYTARARAHPPPPPRLGRAPGSNAPGGPRRRKQSRGPHRSRRQPRQRQPTPLPGLRCGARLARRAFPPRRPTPTPVVRSAGGLGSTSACACAVWAGITTRCLISSRSCTPFATTRLGMRYRLAALSAPSSAS
jgi:hypothetical protein